MGDLEQVDAGAVRDARRQQLRVDVVLHVSHEQEPAGAEPKVQDDRRVVDGATHGWRPRGHLPASRPPGQGGRVVDAQAVAGSEPSREASLLPQPLAECGVPRAGAQHPVLRHAPDVIALHEQRHPRHVVLVRMRQDQQVEAAVPRRQPGVEHGDETVGIRAPIDQHARASRPFHEDRIPLAHIQDGHRESRCAMARDRDGADQHERCDPDAHREHRPRTRTVPAGQTAVRGLCGPAGGAGRAASTSSLRVTRRRGCEARRSRSVAGPRGSRAGPPGLADP